MCCHRPSDCRLGNESFHTNTVSREKLCHIPTPFLLLRAERAAYRAFAEVSLPTVISRSANFYISLTTNLLQSGTMRML